MRSAAWLVAMLVLASCDRIYGLPDRPTADAANPSDDTRPDDANGACAVHPDPTGDDDRDDILNQNDLCPDRPDRGNNEDGDCQADACDLCPQFPGTVDDADGDGIGDECDFPGSVDTLDERRFEGFDHADELILTRFEIDHATATLRLPTPNTAFAWANEPIPTSFQIETRFEVPTEEVTWSIGLMFGATKIGMLPDAWAVMLTRVAPNETRLRLFRVVNGLFMPQNMDRPALVPPGRLRLAVRVVGRDITIVADSGTNQQQEVIAFPSPIVGLQTETSWGVAVTNGATATFDYMTELHHTQ